MANNCADGVYNIHYTDISKNPIVVNKKTLIQDALDITLLGKSRKEYGESFDENILHILENFASPEDANNPGTPDFSAVYANLLEHPTQGQLWYNTTKLRLYVYDGQRWIAHSTSSDIGGNSGIIAHGQQLPRPISQITGYQFTYEECSWIVSPFNFPDEVDYMVCYTDSNALVTSQYRMGDFQTETNGYAFYQILGIKNNNSEGTDVPVVPPLPSPTPLPNVSPTPQPSPGSSPNPTPTVTPTTSLSPSVTRTGTPVPSVSVTPTRTPPASPTPTPSTTPSVQALRATLYITPSKGYPSGTNTQFPSPCTTTNANDSACLYSLGLVVQELSGGVAPYTIDFSNVGFSSSIINTSGGSNPASAVVYSFAGAAGSGTAPVRTGATSTSVLTMSAKITEIGVLGCDNGRWTMGINANSFVTITDSRGVSLVLYTPSGLSGNVYGTSYTTPQAAYSDSWLSVPNCPAAAAAPTSGDGCVAVESIFPSGELAGSMNVGDVMVTNDPYDFFESNNDLVSYAKTKIQQCVRIKTESGASLVCSVTAPIPTLDNGYMLSPTILNRSVPVMRNNITNWELVNNIEFVGEREVRHITVSDKCFWAGETEDAFILHHNKLADDQGA
jgi:hypothetical protein